MTLNYLGIWIIHILVNWEAPVFCKTPVFFLKVPKNIKPIKQVMTTRDDTFAQTRKRWAVLREKNTGKVQLLPWQWKDSWRSCLHEKDVCEVLDKNSEKTRKKHSCLRKKKHRWNFGHYQWIDQEKTWKFFSLFTVPKVWNLGKPISGFSAEFIVPGDIRRFLSKTNVRTCGNELQRYKSRVAYKTDHKKTRWLITDHTVQPQAKWELRSKTRGLCIYTQKLPKKRGKWVITTLTNRNSRKFQPFADYSSCSLILMTGKYFTTFTVH